MGICVKLNYFLTLQNALQYFTVSHYFDNLGYFIVVVNSGKINAYCRNYSKEELRGHILVYLHTLSHKRTDEIRCDAIAIKTTIKNSVRKN